MIGYLCPFVFSEGASFQTAVRGNCNNTIPVFNDEEKGKNSSITQFSAVETPFGDSLTATGRK